MIRFIGSFFGAIFTALTLGVLFGALTLGGIFYSYTRDLPSHESLAQYTPPTISRIYSGEGQMIDEFAQERRLFVPAEEIPDLVKHAFVAAEDQRFYSHHGYDATGMVAAFRDAVLSRGRNLRGAFVIEACAVPSRVALVDDVLTTGATAESLALALRRAGCRRIEVWAVARA